jgi:hypothetical protein
MTTATIIYDEASNKFYVSTYANGRAVTVNREFHTLAGARGFVQFRNIDEVIEMLGESAQLRANVNAEIKYRNAYFNRGLAY